MKAPINARLKLLATLIRDGAVLADVGTDHAYLAIHLLREGRITFAHLSDINAEPLNRARRNVELYELSDRVSFHLTNGAAELFDLGITDYAIAGMGGELIADIISAAPHLKAKNVNLALQPMTKPEVLRAYLYDNGFEIVDEKYASDEGKNYVCIQAIYTSVCSPYSLADIHFGKVRTGIPVCGAEMTYMREQLKRLEGVRRGKRLGGIATDIEDELISALEKRLGQ